MPSRKYQSVTLSSAEGYRYGFNGKEKDKDINSLTAYDYGFRIYNPAIGKFLSVDPISSNFPWNSPYSYAEGDPVNYEDLDGLEKPQTRTAARPRSTRPVTNTTRTTSSGSEITITVIGPNNPPQGHAYVSTYRNDVRGGWDMVGPNGGTSFVPDTKPPQTPPPPLTEQQKKERQFQIAKIKYQIQQGRVMHQEMLDPQQNDLLNPNKIFHPNGLENVSTDYSTLSDEYLKEVDKKIQNKTATPQEMLYASEIQKRKTDGRLSNANVNTGTQLNSKTLWKGEGKERIDVENPNPTQRPGQIHYQDNDGNKYIYDVNERKFKNAPKKVNEKLKDEKVQKAIEKGIKILGG